MIGKVDRIYSDFFARSVLSLLDRVPFPLTDERTFFARNDPQGYLDRQETGTADIEGVTGGMTVAVDDDANDGGARVGYLSLIHI